jgi:L-rhamnose-H+ transport protein
MFVSIVSGVLSACFNFGLEAGKPMAELANQLWKTANPNDGEFLYQNNVTYVVVSVGGFNHNFIWCMILNARNKSFGDYTNKKNATVK